MMDEKEELRLLRELSTHVEVLLVGIALMDNKPTEIVELLKPIRRAFRCIKYREAGMSPE